MAAGTAKVRLEVTVREEATGYEEQSDRLVTVAASPVGVRVVPESSAFKPGLPFSLLVAAEAPDKKPVDTDVQLRLVYWGAYSERVREETMQAATRNGTALVRLEPPAGAQLLQVTPAPAGAPLTVRAGYSPSGTYVHVEQLSQGTLKVGDTARFRIAATGEAGNVYYEVLARGRVVLADFSRGAEIAVPLTPALAPEARLLVSHKANDKIRYFEPLTSLTDQSPTGMFLIERAAEESADWLRPGGWLLVEVAPDRSRGVASLLKRPGVRLRRFLHWITHFR